MFTATVHADTIKKNTKTKPVVSIRATFSTSTREIPWNTGDFYVRTPMTAWGLILRSNAQQINGLVSIW